jgi:metal-sulfur cluster biosynthetic enzyme
MKITEKIVLRQLKQVMDPELNISIVDLGLIYEVKIKEDNSCLVSMTLTSPGCPLYSMIENDIRSKVGELGIKEKNISIKMTFNPPWSIDKMSKKGKRMLGI